LVRVLAVGVLSVLVPWGVLVLLPRRRGLLPPPLLLLPRLGGVDARRPWWAPSWGRTWGCGGGTHTHRGA